MENSAKRFFGFLLDLSLIITAFFIFFPFFIIVIQNSFHTVNRTLFVCISSFVSLVFGITALVLRLKQKAGCRVAFKIFSWLAGSGSIAMKVFPDDLSPFPVTILIVSFLALLCDLTCTCESNKAANLGLDDPINDELLEPEENPEQYQTLDQPSEDPQP